MKSRTSSFREIQILSGRRSLPAVRSKTGRGPLPPQKMFVQRLLPIQIDRRAALAGRTGDKIHIEVTSRSSPRSAIRAITPEFRPLQLSSPGSTDFSEVFMPCPGLTSRHSLAYGNADPARPDAFELPDIAHRRTAKWRRSVFLIPFDPRRPPAGTRGASVAP